MEIKDEFNIKEKLKQLKYKEPKRKILFNMFKSFIVGGGICLAAEVIFTIFFLYFTKEESETFTIIILISLSSLFTGFGLFDKLGDFAGCGTIVPITGFANSMTSSAIEYKTEGVVMGIVNNIYKLAGSVIATAIISGIIFALIKYLWRLIIG